MSIFKVLFTWALALGLMTTGQVTYAKEPSFKKVAQSSNQLKRSKAKSNNRPDRRENRRESKRVEDRRDNRHQDRYEDRRDDRWERYVKFQIGIRLLSLPSRYNKVVVGPSIYYYSDGVYFVKQGSAYVVVHGPVGARVSMLPYGFRSLHVGPRRYFFVNSTYYVYASATNDYVVVAEPANVGKVSEVSKDPIIYPAENQTEEEIDKDRYECHRWALDQSGFDPSSQTLMEHGSDKYYRSLTACLSGRGYTLG
ncbi:MAG: hypothetical protein ACI9FB_002171 [Candidatus Azotimanducaceae bacterium]|jgi:hypothetical protein